MNYQIHINTLCQPVCLLLCWADSFICLFISPPVYRSLWSVFLLICLPYPTLPTPTHTTVFFFLIFFKKKKKGFNEDFHKQVPSVFAVISFFLFHSHHLIFTGIVFILNLKHSWESVGCSNITPPTSTAARWCTHTHIQARSRWRTIHWMFQRKA